MADNCFLFFFDVRFSTEEYLHTPPPRGHSTVGVPKSCEGFVAIWLHEREEFADNHFKLRRASTAMAHREQDSHDDISMMALSQQQCANRARKSIYFLCKIKMADTPATPMRKERSV